IAAILPFLDRFTADGFTAGEWHLAPGQFGWFEFSKPVGEFVQALYDNGWITPSFGWGAWQDEASEYVEKPAKIDSTDADISQKLLATHVRLERFCGGHLAGMFENGHIVALLRRLRKISSTGSPVPAPGTSSG